MSKSILITGSSGFIGTAIIQRFAPHFKIYALDTKSPEEALPENVVFHKIDLTKSQSVRKTIEFIRQSDPELEVASVIHLAAYYDFSGEPSDLYEQVTIKGTERLLHGLLTLPRVEQFIFSSTQLVHAPCAVGERINEEWPLEPKWDYPQSKVKTEKLLRHEHGRIPLVILRIAGVYSDQCHSIPIANQIQRVYEKRLTGHVFPGDTSRGQPFVHLDDLVEAIWLTVENRKKLKEEEVFLIGEPETYSYEALQKELARIIHGHQDWETMQVPKVVAKTGAWIQDKIPGVEDPFIKPWMIDLADDHCQLDIAHAREVLGWTPRHRLISVLPRMVDALIRDPKGFYRLNHLHSREEAMAHAK